MKIITLFIVYFFLSNQVFANALFTDGVYNCNYYLIKINGDNFEVFDVAEMKQIVDTSKNYIQKTPNSNGKWTYGAYYETSDSSSFLTLSDGRIRFIFSRYTDFYYSTTEVAHSQEKGTFYTLEVDSNLKPILTVLDFYRDQDGQIFGRDLAHSCSYL